MSRAESIIKVRHFFELLKYWVLFVIKGELRLVFSLKPKKTQPVEALHRGSRINKYEVNDIAQLVERQGCEFDSRL